MQMNGLRVVFGKWARRERQSVSTVLIRLSEKASPMDVLQCFQTYLIRTYEAVCQMGDIIGVIDQDLYSNKWKMARTNTKTVMTDIVRVFKCHPCLRWRFYICIYISSCLLFFQKSWPQQADLHWCWSFGQPSQPERAVSSHRQKTCLFVSVVRVCSECGHFF